VSEMRVLVVSSVVVLVLLSWTAAMARWWLDFAVMTRQVLEVCIVVMAVSLSWSGAMILWLVGFAVMKKLPLVLGNLVGAR